MMLYKRVLLASVMVAALFPYSLSASITPDDLANEIRFSRACPVQKEIEEAPKSWFSSMRKNSGNILRWLGDSLRQEVDVRTANGKLLKETKEIAAAVASAKTGLPIKESIFNPLGNGLRAIGQFIKGGEETQTTTRIILNNLGLNKSAKESDIEEALRVAATAIIKTDNRKNTAPEDFLKVVKGLNNRGYSTKSLDVCGIYVEALVSEKVRNSTNGTFEEFAASFTRGDLEALENVTPVKMASSVEKRQAMLDYLKAAYKKAQVKVSLESGKY